MRSRGSTSANRFLRTNSHGGYTRRPPTHGRPPERRGTLAALEVRGRVDDRRGAVLLGDLPVRRHLRRLRRWLGPEHQRGAAVLDVAAHPGAVGIRASGEREREGGGERAHQRHFRFAVRFTIGAVQSCSLISRSSRIGGGAIAEMPLPARRSEATPTPARTFAAAVLTVIDATMPPLITTVVPVATAIVAPGVVPAAT